MTREQAILLYKIIDEQKNKDNPSQQADPEQNEDEGTSNLSNTKNRKRKYCETFKQQIANEANRINNNSFIAKKYSLDESVVRNWRKKLIAPLELEKAKKIKRNNAKDQKIQKVEDKLINWIRC